MADINTQKDTTVLDGIITGRVEPHIYAFSTETVPNYLKVGDTVRGVRVRLDEWRRIFPNLIKQYEHSAQIDEDTIFRDYSVHAFLEKEKGKERLQPDTFSDLPYYSNEFFKEATTADLYDAILDIHQSAMEKNGKYQFYTPDRLPQTFTYERKEKFRPRANQQQVIDNFKTAVAAGRTNLLLYAVMRFGKSFTAMCCAKETDAKFVVVVSAKADVKEEWKKTVESHVDFAGYKFLDSDALNRNETVIAETLATADKIALFLTLQDLQGEEIKEKHKEVFEHQIDLLIIDETHFGARAASYGKVLQEQHFKDTEIRKELDDIETLDKVEDAVKALDAKIRIHLSGTPYRILMGDEFRKEDIIAFVQFTDIIDAQKQWDDEHLKEDGRNEWDNPYYGFPQMIRFAFNPNTSSIKKMEDLRKNGITHAFSELFRSQSMKSNANGSHRRLKHEAEVLDLLEVIDGTKEDENLLGFLDYDKIKEGKMCRHIVMVLPFRSSCDAMAALIRREKERFKNLGEYEIINIAGFDETTIYGSTDDVKRAIKDCEEKGRKTLTLTVNRMLTGTTVPEWDTMIFLKGTASPQEYDQAIFRLQNQYVTTFKDEDGNIIRYNMKPQTLLVDFDPDRMFRLQEMKSQLYNVNTEVQGNVQLKERIAKELSVSPIIVLNRNKLQEVTPTDITDAVREYSRNRSIIDDAADIPADNVLLGDADILKVIQGIAPIDAKKGLQIKPSEGEGDDYDTPDKPTEPGNDDAADDNNRKEQPSQQQETEDDTLAKRLAAYYARILFFAFLTESRVKSLEEVIAAIPATEDNQRITKNLGLDINVLRAIQEKSNPFILQKFDYKIENTNDLICDTALQPLERVEVAMRKFGRLSDSEIVTPAKVADKMVANLPTEETNNNEDTKYLDIASKQGEFSIALYKRFGETVKARLYAIPTSTLAYEFTRKIYTLLGMPVENIFSDFTSYDLIGSNNQKIIKKLKDMKFETIIGNPPYQETNLGNGNGSDPIYHLFIDVAKDFSKRTMFIHPARFLFNAGKTPKEWNNKMLNDSHFKVLNYWIDSSSVFPGVEINGGIVSSMWNKSLAFGKIGFFSAYDEIKTILAKVKLKNDVSFSTIVGPREYYHLTNDIYAENPQVNNRQSKGHKYSFGANVFKVFPELFFDQKPKDSNDYLLVYGRSQSQRSYKWIRKNYVTNKENISTYKVVISKADGAAGKIGSPIPARILGQVVVLNPNCVYTDTFIGIGNFQTIYEAEACRKYIMSKFARTMLGTIKVTQDNSKELWANVPMQDFTPDSDIDWSKSIPEIDAQLYAKYGLSEEEIAFIESMIKPMC